MFKIATGKSGLSKLCNTDLNFTFFLWRKKTTFELIVNHKKMNKLVTNLILIIIMKRLT